MATTVKRDVDFLCVIDNGVARIHSHYVVQRVMECSGYRLRTTIHRDAYEFQSWATCELWSESRLEWVGVIHWHGNRVKELPSYVERSDQAIDEACIPVEYELIRQAMVVIDGSEG